MKKVSRTSEVAELRRKAEAWLKKVKEQVETELSESKKVETHRPAGMAEARRLVHELQVQQIQLEMQNKELLRAQTKLEALSSQNADLYERAPVSYLNLGRDGAIRRTNLAGARLLGREKASPVKEHFGLFVAPASRPVFDAFIEKVFKGPGPETCEVEILPEGRDPVWVRIEAGALEDRRSCRAVLMDITSRKRAEEHLVMSEAKLSNALRLASAGHWEYDFINDVFTFNDNFYRIFKTTADEVGGYTMSSAEYARRFCHPDDVPRIGQEIQASIETTDPGFSSQSEHRIIFADGTVGHMAVRFFIVKDSRGRTTRSFGVNQDITERKRAEETLREQLAELKRWHDATEGREMRVLELKKEVNELLRQAGQPPRYASAEAEKP